MAGGHSVLCPSTTYLTFLLKLSTNLTSKVKWMVIFTNHIKSSIGTLCSSNKSVISFISSCMAVCPCLIVVQVVYTDCICPIIWNLDPIFMNFLPIACLQHLNDSLTLPYNIWHPSFKQWFILDTLDDKII